LKNRRKEKELFSNPEWKRKLWAFSRACTKWGVDEEQTNRMNRSIQSAHGIDQELYKFCKFTAERHCLTYLNDMRNRQPRDAELKKAWHQHIGQDVRMTHPDKGYEL